MNNDNYPESMHSPLFVLTHSLIGGVVVALLIRSLGSAKTDSTLHKASRANQPCDGTLGIKSVAIECWRRIRHFIAPYVLEVFPPQPRRRLTMSGDSGTPDRL